MDNNKVIVIGSSHHNTLGVIRSLGEKGLLPFLILKDKQDKVGVSKSKYINKWWLCFTDEEILNCLLIHFSQEMSKPVIISTTDSTTQLLDQNRSILEDKFYLPLCSVLNRVVELMDKSVITNLARQYDICTPRSWIIKNRTLVDDIIYPCLAKPLSSLVGHKSDICDCHNKNELIQLVQSPDHCNDYLVQEVVNKDREISILGMVTYDRRQIIFSGCIDKLRTAGRGSSSFAVMLDNSFLGDEKEKLETLLLSTGYTGLFSAEYLQKDDKYYFLEINFRNDGNGYVPTAAGLNLPYLWYLSCIGHLTEAEIISSKPIYPCYFMAEIADFVTNVLKKKISFKHWNKDRKLANCFLLYNKMDNAPFKYSLKKQMSYQVKKIFSL